MLPDYIKILGKLIIRMPQYVSWQLKGYGIPYQSSAFTKQSYIRHYQEKSGYGILIETGTFKGDMIAAQIDNFKMLYSIELAPYYYEEAKRRFSQKDNVKLYLGDSSQILPEILKSVHQSCIFWLDGHYSGGLTARGGKECPVMLEIQSILNTEKIPHIILIDDARKFKGSHDYPPIKDIKLWMDKP